VSCDDDDEDDDLPVVSAVDLVDDDVPVVEVPAPERYEDDDDEEGDVW
jgi:hypothetical protein